MTIGTNFIEHKKSNREYKGNSTIDTLDNYTIIDIETTGIDPKIDKIIELAALKVRNNEIIDSYSKLINPGVEIDLFISNLTGITNDMIENAPCIENVIEEFLNFIGEDTIIGHNVNFDINFIYDTALFLLDRYLSNDFIDTLRISRNYISSENYKLKTLATLFNIDYTNAHRSLKDCHITFELYNILKEKISNSPKLTKHSDADIHEITKQLLDNFVPPKENIFLGKKIAIKRKVQNYGNDFIKEIAQKCGANVRELFLNDTDILILSTKMYKLYFLEEQFESEIKNRAKELEKNGTLKVISEEQFLNINNIPLMSSYKKNIRQHVTAKDIKSTNELFDISNPFYQKECVFTGTLEKMTRKEAMQIVANLGGKNRDTVTQQTNFLILGNNDYCKSIKNGKSSKQKKAESYKLNGQDIEIISENVFYDLLEDFI